MIFILFELSSRFFGKFLRRWIKAPIASGAWVQSIFCLEIDQTIKSDLVIENSIVISNLFMRLTVGLSVTISWEILFWSLSQMLSVLNTFQIPTGSIKILKTEFTIMMRKGLQMIIMTTDINR